MAKTQKMTNKEAVWVAGFMGVTAAAVTLELVAVGKKHEHYPAWTTLTVRYVPKPVAMAALGYLATWAPLHFLKAYKKAGK